MSNSAATIDQLIINSPFEEPRRHWAYDPATRLFSLKEGRRPAGYVVATPGSRAFDDPGLFVELPLVNQIRPRVNAWRAAGYPGVTGITKRLLAHWRDPEERRDSRFFFCQLEAMETLIWMTEASPTETQGIDIPGDGGLFSRLCAKMATGSGKTIVMAMLIAWQVLNKVAYPRDARFAKHVLIITPGLTVKNRLHVLHPSAPGNYYQAFNVAPANLLDKLRQGKVLIHNYHKLIWETEEQLEKKRGVDKRGAKSDDAYAREVLGEMANARNLLVINDEAHHAWRVPPKSTIKGVAKEDIEEATKWVGGLDRIHQARGILACYDFTATPFAPTGRRSGEETLFAWIVCDFGLNDAIESGLVKTPRVVIRDDGRLDAHYRSRLYHIYADAEVKDDFNRKAQAHEPLPDLVANAYDLLGKDWQETLKVWQERGMPTPPVMITVANRTETAARVKYAFDKKKIHVDELCDPARVLHIDSRVLDRAESREEAIALQPQTAEDEDDAAEPAAPKLTKDQQAEQLRRTVDTVGKRGEPGELVRNVISVGMLSEGWDARTVTHIMGLRAFTSQLLCEQVVGRGLRRTSYEVGENGLYAPEYVNIFGVPFSFLPHEGGGDEPPPPPEPRIPIEAMKERRQYAITWPNIIRIDHVYEPRLSLDWDAVTPLELDAMDAVTRASLAAIIEGKPDVTRLSDIDLQDLARKYRLQRVIFEVAAQVYDQMQPSWQGNREFLLAQVIKLAEGFIASDRITIIPLTFGQDSLRRRILLMLNMNKVVQHIWEAIRYQNTLALKPVFDSERPIRATGDMPTWFTSRPNELTRRSHVNRCVFDSTWEAGEAYELDHHPLVAAWVKNDHLGFEILYIYQGVVRKYRPDFLIRLTNGATLVLEVKGQDSQENRTKRTALDEWVRAVNAHRGFGPWAWDVSYHPKDVGGIVERHGGLTS